MGRSSGLLSTLLGLVAVALAVWWLRQPDPPPPEEPPRPPFVLPVTLETVQRDTLRPRVPLTGTVTSPARARLAFEAAGTLVELAIREVDEFDTGDVLAQLQAEDEELTVARAEADLTLAQRELDLLEAGTRAEDLDRLAAELEEDRAREALALTEAKRGVKLLEDKVISQADLDRLQAEHAAAVARTAAKVAELAAATAGAREEDLDIARAKVARAQAQLNLANRDLEKTRLVATQPGVVLQRLASVGDHLAVGTPVLEVIDPSELEVEVEIPGRFALDLAELPGVVLTLDDLPGWSLKAVLDATIPAADERSRNFTGLVRIEAKDAGVLRPGMFVRVDLELRPKESALVIPADAVRRTPEGPQIVRAVEVPAAPPDPGGLEAQVLPVALLAADDGRCAVEAPGAEPPLSAGDSIVVTGVDRAVTGVRLLPAGAGPPQSEEEAPR